MEIIKAFNSNNLHTEIVIKGTISEPLFRASDIGEILEMGNIRTSIQQFDETERHVHTMDTSTGPKQVTFLTEKGLYKVLFKSRKPIAEKFQNWVCEVVKEIRLNGVYDLQKQLLQVEHQKEKEYEVKLEKQKVLEREKVILKEYATIGSIIYIIKVKTFENGQYIIKIGESRRGIKDRYNEHKSKYEECLLLDCFAVNKSKDFESFLHNNEIIKCDRVKDLKGHETELELFLIGKNLTYKRLIDIINNNIKYFNNNDTNKIELENEQLKLMLEMKNTNNDNLLIQELIQTVKQMSGKIDDLEKSNKELLQKFNSTQSKIVTGFNEPLVTLGPRLQKINPETLELIKVYETVSEAMKEDSNIKRPSINKAIVENTVYNGYRWLFVVRELDANIIHNILPTRQSRQQNIGYIAQINKEKTEIINVYLDRKTASHFNGYESSAALDNHVKNNSLTKGYYYKLYNDCDEILKDNFVEKNKGDPLLYKNGVGQYDSSNNLIKEFECKYECIKQLKISDKTLVKALDKSIMYQNCYYKNIGSKLKCF
uniref:Bro-N domain-containing protein n=1 Tax=viral metagenome TaxID=1070528 RepID=A0A6C0IFR8_9ZZZZ